MSDFPFQHDSPTNAAEFTVSELSGALKRTVEDAFGNVRVRGEISGYRGPHSSGHAYFALKDERSRLEAVIWKGTFSKLRFRPEEGMEVIASGKLTTYPGSSKYQIVIENLEPAGVGALMALLEERKRKLTSEGLFDPARKQLLPFMPLVVGVVTSPTGAVIRDIIHRISDRFPLRVVVWPVRVQGETSGTEVANAIDGFNSLDPLGPIPLPDVLIVARGGGSLEDLWGFNDEAVVRATANSNIPIISAVGHETDWTLIDHAADVRAPTPTGAAELAVPVRAELEAALSSLSARLRGAAFRNGDRKKQALRAAARALPSADQLLALPRRRFDEAANRLERALTAGTEAKRLKFRGIRLSPTLLERRIIESKRRLERDSERLPSLFRNFVAHMRMRLSRSSGRVTSTALERRLENSRSLLTTLQKRSDQIISMHLERKKARLGQAVRLTDTLSHKAVLKRGFALVRNIDGQPVKSANDISPADMLSIEFADGHINAQAKSKPAQAQRITRKQPTKPDGNNQGSLF